MNIVGTTIRRTFNFLVERKINFEIIAVNDGSSDQSWEVLQNITDELGENVISISLLKNSGQHSALLCGLIHSKGEWVITIDDDLQIPPEEIGKLMNYAKGNTDLVVGKYKEKRHPLMRRLGSQLVQKLNENIFGKPADFTITSFRMMRQDVVERIIQWKTPYPYINGLMLLCSSERCNVLVDHNSRSVGTSGYGTRQIAALIFRILFNYSTFPLRFVLTIAFSVSFISFTVGLFFIVQHLLGNTAISGWTSIVTLLAFFNSFTVVMLAMIGEYILILVRQVSNNAAFSIREIYKK